MHAAKTHMEKIRRSLERDLCLKRRPLLEWSQVHGSIPEGRLDMWEIRRAADGPPIMAARWRPITVNVSLSSLLRLTDIQ
jgi:hypothetical protein